MNKYLQLLRPQNGIIGVIGLIASAFIASGVDIVDSWMDVLVACIIITLFMGGGNALNDYIDREIDKVSHPERPVPSGRMTAKTALHIGYGLLLISVVLSLFFRDLLSISIVIIACALMFAYEMLLKQRGFIGNITIAVLTGMIFLLGGAIVGSIEKTMVLAGMAMLVNIGREIVKDIQDMDGDEGRKTLPMMLGKRKAGCVAAAFYIAGPVLSIVPVLTGMFGPLYYVVAVPDAMFIYASYILFTDPRRSQKIAKYAMLVALLAFMLGVI